MQRGFGKELWSSFKKVYGPVVGAAGIIVGVLLYLFAFSQNLGLRVSLAATIAVFTLMLLLILTLFDAAYELHKRGSGKLPRVLAGMNPFAGSSGSAMCMLEASDLFSYDIAVSFYKVEDQGFERPIGIGSVVNIQRDGKILVAMTVAAEDSDEFVNRLRTNDAAALKVTRIKPHVSQQLGLEWLGESE